MGRPKNHIPISYMKYKNDDGTISIFNYDKKAARKFQLAKTATNINDNNQKKFLEENTQVSNLSVQADCQDYQDLNSCVNDCTYSDNNNSNSCSNYVISNVFNQNTDENQPQVADCFVNTDTNNLADFHEQNENNVFFTEEENSSFELFNFDLSNDFTSIILDTNENDDISNFTLDDFNFSF